MRNPLILKISVADPSPSAKVDEVYKDIENSLEGAECYRLDRTQVTAAAIEFLLILSGIANVATIASLLYQIWKDHKDEGQLYVAVNPDRGIQIMISEATSEIEIEDFQRKINKVVASGQLAQMDQKILEEIKRRRIWIRTR